MAAILDRHRARILAAPDGWAEIVGNEKSVKLCKYLAGQVRTTGDSDVALLWGASGTGKSLCAALMAREAGIPESMVIEVASGDWQAEHASEVIDMVQRERLYGGRAVIIEEIDTGSGPAIGKLLTFLERLPKHCIILMTSNLKPGELLPGAHGVAYHRRVTAIQFGTDGLQRTTVNGERVPGPCGPMLQRVMQAEGLDGQDVDFYQKIACNEECKSNIGLMILRAQRLAIEEQINA